MNHSIAFVGAGKMVSAIVHGLLRSKSLSPAQICCCSAKDGTSQKLAKSTSIGQFDMLEEMLSTKPSILVLGCKPQQLSELPHPLLKIHQTA